MQRLLSRFSCVCCHAFVMLLSRFCYAFVMLLLCLLSRFSCVYCHAEKTEITVILRFETIFSSHFGRYSKRINIRKV